MPFAKRILPLTVLWCAMARIRWRIPPLPRLPCSAGPQAHCAHRQPEAHQYGYYGLQTNLLDSFVCACDRRIPGVQIVFGGAVILRDPCARLFKSFGAFSSINYPVLGVVQDNCLVPYIRPQAQAEPVFYDALNSRVALLKLIPGASAGQLRFLLD